MISTHHVLKKFNHSAINSILAAMELPEENIQMLQDLRYDLPILNKLQEMQQFEAAIYYLAAGLPKREAIWWGFVCSQQAEQASDNPTVQEALTTVEAWVRNPSEEKRQQAGKLGEALEYYTSSSWIATAVFWSGGSIAKDRYPVTEPTNTMYCEAVTNAILLAAQKIKSTYLHSVMQYIIKRGIHIAMGGNGKIIIE